MFGGIGKAFAQMFSRGFRGVLWRSLFLTLGAFIVLFVGAEWGIGELPKLGYEWVNTAVTWITPVLFLVLMFFLGAPVAGLMATLFLDEIAAKVEARHYPNEPGHATPFLPALWSSLTVTLALLIANLVMLPLHLFLPVIGSGIVVLVNGWLIGREYFEAVALRYMTLREAKALRRRRGFGVWMAGIVIALVALVPDPDLLAPLFGTAYMVHVFKTGARA